MELDRRNVLSVLAGVGATAGLAACSDGTEAVTKDPSQVTGYAPEPDTRFPALPKTLLVNRERAHAEMVSAGVEAIICARPENIYYLTNHHPQLVDMGMHGLAYAILPLDQTEAPILIIGEFAYYLGVTERATPDLVEARLFTSPAEQDAYFAGAFTEKVAAEANPSFLPTVHDAQPLHWLEQRRREITQNVQGEMAATSGGALVRAVRDLALAGKRVAVDEASIAALLDQAEAPIVPRDGEHLLRRIRLQKSAAELDLARYAARANAEAALAAAKTIREGASYQEMRSAYADECATRLLTPSFMVIDGIIPDMAPGRIEEGRAFLIDCVSTHQGYHGDYGRTVCVGEPTGQVARATDALAKVWERLLPELKPGLRYSEITSLASEVFSDLNSDAALICNPHSVGLHHTDEPGREGATHWAKDDLELVENMVLSVDLPMVDLGLGGSGHLEDLVLITSEGAELLNDAGDQVILV